jgi:prepilin-type N-terminal cleavage/methylation domain-containing protein
MKQNPGAGFRGGRRFGGGFTLVEVMVVVVIISVLAAISVPSLQRIQRKAKVTTIANDFRVFAAAFDTYAQETGTWPAEVAAGAIPAVMSQRLKADAWLRKTPMGGQYNWEYNQFNLFGTYKAAIAISATPSSPLPLDVNMLYDLEHTIDSPNTLDWANGSFRLGTGIVPLYLIQQ